MNCELCNYCTGNPSNWKKHLLTKKHRCNVEGRSTRTIYRCELCDYETHHKANYDKHLWTKAHMKREDEAEEEDAKCYVPGTEAFEIVEVVGHIDKGDMFEPFAFMYGGKYHRVNHPGWTERADKTILHVRFRNGYLRLRDHDDVEPHFAEEVAVVGAYMAALEKTSAKAT